MPKPLQRLCVAGQFLVQNPVEQFGAAVAFYVFPDRLPNDILHGPLLKLSAPAQHFDLSFAQP
jgi:hypothetical protein